MSSIPGDASEQGEEVRELLAEHVVEPTDWHRDLAELPLVEVERSVEVLEDTEVIEDEA